MLKEGKLCATKIATGPQRVEGPHKAWKHNVDVSFKDLLFPIMSVQNLSQKKRKLRAVT